MKYGIKDVFAWKFYDLESRETLFSIDTTTSNYLDVDIRNNYIKLSIRDCLIDAELCNDILKGKYDEKYFKVVGDTFVRGLDGVDRPAVITIKDARLRSYHIGDADHGESVIVIGFNKHNKLSQNMELSVKEA